MPDLLESSTAIGDDPFADLIPSESSGSYGDFSDLVPSTPGGTQNNYGDFSDLVPASPTSESEKALAETPLPKEQAQATPQADTGVVHQTLNAVRVFGSAAGKYIFHGLQGLELETAKILANPPAELTTPQAEAVLLPKDQQDALEARYVTETQAAVPEALARAEYWKGRAEGADVQSEVDPALANTIPARLSAAAGHAVAMGMESLIPGAGLPIMVMHGALATEAEAMNAGKTPAEAEAAAVRSAIGLGIFGGASKLAALGVARLLPNVVSDPGKLTTFVAQFTGQEAANETSSRAIGAWEAAENAPEGQKVKAAINALSEQTLEGAALNLVFAGMGAAKATGRVPERATSPVSEPVRFPAPETGVVPETARYTDASQRKSGDVEVRIQEQFQQQREQLTPLPQAESRQPEPHPSLSAAEPSPIVHSSQSEPTRTEPNAAREIGITSAFSDLGKGVSDNFYTAAFDALKAGKQTISGVKDPILAKAKPFYDTGLIRSPQELKAIIQSGDINISSERIPNATSKIGPDVNDWTTATLPSLKIEPSRAVKEPDVLGAVAPGTAQLQKAGSAITGAAKRLKGDITGLSEFHDFRKARLGWSARGQQSTGEITRASKELQKSVPDPTRRAAITNWIQAGGDKAVLAQRAADSKNTKLRKGYEAAVNLTPKEEALAGKVRQTFDILRKRAVQHGIEINELDNYVNQIWRRSALKEFATTFSGRKLNTSIRFAKKRFHDSFFHGEQAGLVPETKDISRLLPIYMSEVNNAINAKQFVADMAKGWASDGRPLLAPRGSGKVLPKEDGTSVSLIYPERALKDTGDYKVMNQPALQEWTVRLNYESGDKVLVKGDLAVHPEAYSHIKNMLGQSAIREWYQSPSESALGDMGKGTTKFLLDDLQQTAKATMLGFLSPFHQVQEGTHAIGHKVNPFGGLPKIDLSKPNQRDAAEHGLMLLPDRVSMAQFREGLDGSTRNLVANVLGKAGGPIGKRIKEWADGYQHYLFHEYIPALKLKTYEHILERNQKRFTKELTSGKATLAQVKFLSAEQSNAAYGHLNYADMNRNPTLQHIAQVFLLAPDFLEARGRFAGQAVKGLVTKAGREQLAAIGTLAATQFVLARILNKTLDDDYHFDEPFAVVVGNRKYTMRSVPEDIYKAYQDWRKFTTGRLSPMVGRGLLEGLSGINYRNEPTSIGETFTNILAGMVPLTLQPATRGLTETTRDNPVSPFEQLLGSLGLHVSRFSPTSKVYHLAKEWQEANGLEQKKGLYPRSKYQQLRYALEDGDFDKARAAIDKLVADGEKKAGITEGFRSSILHPFTGSQANDLKFKKSLSADNQFIYEAAIKRRQELLRRYRTMQSRR